MDKKYLPQIQVLRTLADMKTMNLQDGISVLVAEDLTVYQISSVTKSGAIALANGKYAIPILIAGSGSQSNADFLKQAKAVGLAENDLEDVDLQKLADKFYDSSAGKDLQRSIKTIEENTQDVATALTKVDQKADSDLRDINTRDLSRAIRLTGAFKELEKRPLVVDENFFYLEEQNDIVD